MLSLSFAFTGTGERGYTNVDHKNGDMQRDDRDGRKRVEGDAVDGVDEKVPTITISPTPPPIVPMISFEVDNEETIEHDDDHEDEVPTLVAFPPTLPLPTKPVISIDFNNYDIERYDNNDEGDDGNHGNPKERDDDNDGWNVPTPTTLPTKPSSNSRHSSFPVLSPTISPSIDMRWSFPEDDDDAPDGGDDGDIANGDDDARDGGGDDFDESGASIPTIIPTIAPYTLNTWITSQSILLEGFQLHDFNEMIIQSATLSGGYIGSDIPGLICINNQYRNYHRLEMLFMVYIIDNGFTKFVQLALIKYDNSFNIYIEARRAGSWNAILNSCQEGMTGKVTDIPIATCTTCPGFGVNNIKFVTSYNTPTIRPSLPPVLPPTFGPFIYDSFVTTTPTVIQYLQLKSMDEITISVESMGGSMISLGLFKQPALTPCLLETSTVSTETLHHYIIYLDDNYDKLLKMVLLKCEIINNMLYIQGIEAGYKQSKFESCKSVISDWILRSSVPLAECSTCTGLGIKDVKIDFQSNRQSSNRPFYETNVFWVNVLSLVILALLPFCIGKCIRNFYHHKVTMQNDQLPTTTPMAEVVSVGVLATAVYEKVPTGEVEMI